MKRSLEDVLQTVNPVDLLRNSQIGPYVYPVVPPEFTNWRDEQRAWQQSCVLFNQSFHMTDMYVQGPDAFKLLHSLGVNSFKNFEPNKAKQYVVCNYDGFVIGDVVLFYLDKDLFRNRLDKQRARRVSCGASLMARSSRWSRKIRSAKRCGR